MILSALSSAFAALGDDEATLLSPSLPVGNSLNHPFRPVPVPQRYGMTTGFSTLRGLKATAAGSCSTIAMSDDKTVWGTGSDAKSPLGSDTVFFRPIPIPIDP